MSARAPGGLQTWPELTLRWRRVVYDFLEELRAFLGADQEVYKVTFLKLGTALQSGFTLAAPRDAG